VGKTAVGNPVEIIENPDMVHDMTFDDVIVYGRVVA
jgi:hypothetical protein